MVHSVKSLSKMTIHNSCSFLYNFKFHSNQSWNIN